VSEINSKLINTEYGSLHYYRTTNRSSSKNFDILFLHGIGEDKDWFLEQYGSYSLDKYSWIVPDYIGHGRSAKPRDSKAYTMHQQAKSIHHLLKEEHVKSIIILAHSMGGPISISLIEALKQENKVEILGLFYLEGNLDENDTFFSSKVSQTPLEEFEQTFEPWTKHVTPFPIWASSIDLVEVSKTNQLLPRLQKHLKFHSYFVFGEKNKGRFSSEKLVQNLGLEVKFIPDSEHFMYKENPTLFWKYVCDKISEITL